MLNKDSSAKTPIQPCLLDIADAAAYLGIKVSYLRYLIHKKKSPEFIQLGGRSGKLYFSVDDLNDFIKDKKGQK